MIHLNYIIIIHVQIIRAQTGIPDKLLHAFKSLRPDGIVQTFSLCTFRVTVGSTPPASSCRRQLCCRQTLQCFHTGIIIIIVCSKPTDSYLVKCLTGGNKAIIICRKRDIILFKKIFINHKTVCIRTHRKPVYASILIHKIAEVAVINSTGRIGCGKIHQAVFEGIRIMQ